jgi:hypothetical protein
MTDKVKQRLFPRQMWHLALANLLHSVWSIPQALMESTSVINVASQQRGFYLCQILDGPCFGFDFVCCCVETQIAIGFALMQFRCLRGLKWAGCCLPLAWPIGCIFATTTRLFITYDSTSGMCNSVKSSSRLITPCVMIGCLAVSMAAYIATLVIHWRGNTVGRTGIAILKRNVLYPIAFLITYGPISTYYLFPDFPENTKKIVVPAAVTMLSMNGFVNVLTYACTFYGYRRLSRTLPTKNEDESESACSEIFGDRDFHSKTSFQVGFAGSHVETFISDTAERNSAAWLSWHDLTEGHESNSSNSNAGSLTAHESSKTEAPIFNCYENSNGELDEDKRQDEINPTASFRHQHDSANSTASFTSNNGSFMAHESSNSEAAIFSFYENSHGEADEDKLQDDAKPNASFLRQHDHVNSTDMFSHQLLPPHNMENSSMWVFAAY